MLISSLVEYCAPTLAGIKTGSMFLEQGSSPGITDAIRQLNRRLTRKGLRLLPLRSEQGKTLLYLYRPEALNRDLSAPEARRILKEKGYPCGRPECCIVSLIGHLMHDQQFPHEIGLFLGYPPEDVQGFMKDCRAGVKCVGCWKVYGNEERSRRLFDRYKRCTERFCSRMESGETLEEIIDELPCRAVC